MEAPLFQSLFDEEERRPWTVSELNSQVRQAVEMQFASVWLEGEVVDFRRASSGHWYFNLNDGAAQLKCVCWKGTNFRIRFKPENGLTVRVRGRLTFWEAKGELKLTVDSIEPVGEGALLIAFEQIKAKLFAEGLFDEGLKQPIPPFPRRVGVVTSPTGAALQDILTVLDRRARSVHIVVVPTLVQGERSGELIAEAIRLANDFNTVGLDRIDVLIVGRGGGSAEDLAAFNEEQVARAIRASLIPVISAVGHEVDFTIADLAADLRAPTPSAAAEIVAKAEADVIEHLSRSTAELARSMSMRMFAARADIQSLAMAAIFSEFPARVRELRFRIESLVSDATAAQNAEMQRQSEVLAAFSGRLSPLKLSAHVAQNARKLALLDQRNLNSASENISARYRKFENSVARLDSLSPLEVLSRGYSITQKTSGEIVREAHQTTVGERLNIRLANGKLETEVTNVSFEN